MGHLRFDRKSQKFVPHIPSKDSLLKIEIQPDSEGLLTLCKISKNEKELVRRSHEAVADTGAAICCAPVEEIKNLGLNRADIMKSTLKLYAADGRRLEIEGCIPIQISAFMQDGVVTVKDIIYFIKNLDQVFLSKDALIALGSIP